MSNSFANESSALELAAAMSQFRQLVDPAMLDELQPSGAQAVYTPWVTVWLLIYQRLHSNACLTTAVAELLSVAHEFSSNKRVQQGKLSGNSAAYSRARSRLTVSVADKVTDHVFETLIATVPTSLAERRTFLLDGTTLSLSSNSELRERWPAGKNQHGPGTWPIAHLLLAHEVETGMALRPEVGAMYGPNADSELALAQRLIPRLPACSVLLADRNFGVFALVHAAVATQHDVVSRLTAPRFRSLQRSAEELGPGRWRLHWRPSRWDRKMHPELPVDSSLTVYLHEFVGFSGQTLWLLSTLDASVEQLAELYAERWGIETDIRHLKKKLQLDAVRGQSVDMVLKELAMATVAYNLVVQVRRLAAAQAQVEPRRISFSGVWSLVTIMLLRPNEWTALEWQQRFEWALRAAAQRKIPNRPGRSYARQVLPRRQKYPVRSRPATGEPPK